MSHSLLIAQAASIQPPGQFWDSTGNVALILIFGGAFLTAIVAVVAGVSQKVLVSRNRERTRQEIAAYVAEGTMTADEGERLLQAGK